MKLKMICDSKSSDLRLRIMNALQGKGKSTRGGIFGIADEFDCDLNKADQYAEMLDGGTYGEVDIKDKILHRSRAPQNILKLLRYYEVSKPVSKKLINFYTQNSHTTVVSDSQNDKESFKQLLDNKRLVSMVTDIRFNKGGISKEQIEEAGFSITPTPWNNNVWYVYRPENVDIVDAIVKSYTHDYGQKVGLIDLLHGLAFGYKMVDVYNYMRHGNQQLVDRLCKNVNDL